MLGLRGWLAVDDSCGGFGLAESVVVAEGGDAHEGAGRVVVAEGVADDFQAVTRSS